jgi:putative transposase
MSRRARIAPGGIVYHALNRAAARLPLFQKDGDYDAFERVMAEAMEQRRTRLLAYCLMPNHWHMVVWPERDGELSSFVGWLSLTHAMRYRTHYHDSGSGHLYQQRYKSFPVQSDAGGMHFLRVCRYVERNALRAGLVQGARDWRWCSLWRRLRGDGSDKALLHPWPVDEGPGWPDLVDEPQSDTELKRLRLLARRGAPYGEDGWQRKTAALLKLDHTLRPQGRPRKSVPDPACAEARDIKNAAREIP